MEPFEYVTLREVIVFVSYDIATTPDEKHIASVGADGTMNLNS